MKYKGMLEKMDEHTQFIVLIVEKGSHGLWFQLIG
jgi:hypothetical protein